MNCITSKSVTTVFGFVFLVTGILGIIPNPLVSPHGIFEVNATHNLVHILTAGLFVAGALASEKAARVILQSIGIAFVGVTILGFLNKGHLLLGLVYFGEAAKWAHLSLALVILVAGFGLPKLQACNTTREA